MTNQTNEEPNQPMTDQDRDDPSLQTNLWPYSAASGILDRGLATAIRKWALSGAMSEAELNALSQRQALRAFIDQHIVPTLDRVIGRQRSPEESQALAEAAMARGDLFGFPLDPQASLKATCPRGRSS
jgi:hypothetical protein